jgi:hypothetical protein
MEEVMRYMLLIYNSEKDSAQVAEGDRGKMMGEYMAFTDGIRASGHYRAGDPLTPTASATSVRIRGGKLQITDGPFADTREQLGGYYIVDAKDLDEAIAIAQKIPGARTGTVEVRAIVQMPAAATV